MVAVSLAGSQLSLTEMGVGDAEITVTADDGNGGTAQTMFEVEVREEGTVTSIEDNNRERLISLYPNPAGNSITLSLGQTIDLREATINLFDPAGNKLNINSEIGDDVIIDLKNVKSGLYIIQIDIEDEMIIKRFIKE